MNSNLLSRRTFLNRTSAVTASLIGASSNHHAFALPTVDQLRIICGTPAGSVPDTVARHIAAHLASSYPRGVLVDNRPGAAGQIAINALKTAPTDGSTVLLTPDAVATIYPYIYSKLAYDPVLDLKPVSMAAQVTLGLAVGPAVPASVSNTSDFIEWMRRNPRLANVGSPGAGTPPHLLEAILFRQLKVEWQHISYAGGPPAMTDLMSGQIAALVLPEGILRQPRAAGKLRVLATSGAQRTVYLPDVPTLGEQGYSGIVMNDWFSFFMSGKVSQEVVDATSKLMRVAIAQPELATAFSESGLVAVSSTPGALAMRIASERRYWESAIRENGIRID